MEKFRKQLTQRLIIHIFISLILIIFIILKINNILLPNGTSTFTKTYDSVTGLTTMGISLFYIRQTLIYHKALRSDITLKKLYNFENDERRNLINIKSGNPIILICSSIILLAAIVSSFVNATVFYTLISCAVFLVIVSISLKIYLSKKY